KRRTVVTLPPVLAPYRAAVFPPLRHKPELVEKPRGIYEQLLVKYLVARDDRGNIGQLYHAQVEIGPPFSLAVDFQSLEDDAGAVRHRDALQQDRVRIAELKQYLATQLEGK